MEWDDLKYFLAVARTGSLTEAARALKVSPATVGRRVAELERRLGARLFDRRQTGHTLTDLGESIRIKAEEVEEAVLAVERQVVGRDLRPTGKVRLATTEDIATVGLVPHLPDFHREFPGISLEIVTRSDLVNLSRREADVALRGARPQHGDFIMRSAGDWACGLYAARAYAKAHGLKPGLTDLSNAEIITWTEEWAHLRGGPWFAEHARNVPVALAASSSRLHHVACRAGLGVAILPSLAGDHDPELICLLPPERVLTVKLWLVVHRELSRTARVRAVIDFVAKVGASWGR